MAFQPNFVAQPTTQTGWNPNSPTDPQAFADSIARLANTSTTGGNLLTTPTSPYPPLPPSPIGVSPVSPSSPSMPQPYAVRIPEDALEFLRSYDTVIVVDDSGSMLDDSRWQEASDALSSFVDLASRYDTDGVDICFLNSPVHRNVTHVSQVQDLFHTVKPSGGTYIGEKLDQLTRDYFKHLKNSKPAKPAKLEKRASGIRSFFRGGPSNSSDPPKLKKSRGVKPINYIVITDGQPSDEPADVIKQIAEHLDKKHYPVSQLGIQFLQIGNDRQATRYLQELDDDLHKSGCRDIVDTTPYTGYRLSAQMIAKVLLGGINRRVDNKGGASVM